MAEWSNAAVLKTVEGHTSGGSNPSSSAKKSFTKCEAFFIPRSQRSLLLIDEGDKKEHTEGVFFFAGPPKWDQRS